MTIQSPTHPTPELDTRFGRQWLYGPRRRTAAVDQQAREARIHKLLPDDEDESDAKAYDARLTRRLIPDSR